jgi:hypothetical protein
MFFYDSGDAPIANLHIDLGDDALQDQVNDIARRFRQQAPAMLNEEIRSRLMSLMDFTFHEEYMLDLILHEAVSSVVRHLTTNVPISRSDSEAQPETALQGPDSSTGNPSRFNTATDETSQPLLGRTIQISQYPGPPTRNHPRNEYGAPSENEIHSQTFATQQVLDPSPSSFDLELFPPSSNLHWPGHAEQGWAVFSNDLLSPAR